MSAWTKANTAAMMIVMPPITAITLKCCPATLMSSPVWNSGYSRATRNTPATTIVLECSSELTGVGPAIASGSHVCNGNWPLLPIAAMNKATQLHNRIACEPVLLSAHSLMVSMLNPLDPLFSFVA